MSVISIKKKSSINWISYSFIKRSYYSTMWETNVVERYFVTMGFGKQSWLASWFFQRYIILW